MADSQRQRLTTNDYDDVARRRLGDGLSAARNARRWSQKDLALRAGISKRSVVNAEGGKPGVGEDVLQAMASVYDEWDEWHTPRRVLEGAEAPKPPSRAELVQAARAELPAGKPDFPAEMLWRMVKVGYAQLPDVEEELPDRAPETEARLRELARQAVRAEARESADATIDRPGLVQPER